MLFLLLACSPHKGALPTDSGGTGMVETADTAADTSADTGADTASSAVLYVSSYFGGLVHRYDPATGAALAPIADVPGAQSIVLHEGQLYLVAEQSNAVLRADPETGAVTGTFIADEAHVSGPTAAIVGPDGYWYVGCYNTDNVLRFDADGAYVDEFVAPGTDGLDGPDIGLTFDGEGRLLVPGYDSSAVHVFGPDGTPEAQLLTRADGLVQPRGIFVAEDGRIWVASRGSDTVIARAADGTLSEITGIRRPSGLTVHNGELLVASEARNTVRAYDAETGEDLGIRVEDAEIDGATSVAVW